MQQSRFCLQNVNLAFPVRAVLYGVNHFWWRPSVDGELRELALYLVIRGAAQPGPATAPVYKVRDEFPVTVLVIQTAPLLASRLTDLPITGGRLARRRRDKQTSVGVRWETNKRLPLKRTRPPGALAC